MPGRAVSLPESCEPLGFGAVAETVQIRAFSCFTGMTTPRKCESRTKRSAICNATDVAGGYAEHAHPDEDTQMPPPGCIIPPSPTENTTDHLRTRPCRTNVRITYVTRDAKHRQRNATTAYFSDNILVRTKRLDRVVRFARPPRAPKPPVHKEHAASEIETTGRGDDRRRTERQPGSVS